MQECTNEEIIEYIKQEICVNLLMKEGKVIRFHFKIVCLG